MLVSCTRLEIENRWKQYVLRLTILLMLQSNPSGTYIRIDQHLFWQSDAFFPLQGTQMLSRLSSKSLRVHSFSKRAEHQRQAWQWLSACCIKCWLQHKVLGKLSESCQLCYLSYNIIIHICVTMWGTYFPVKIYTAAVLFHCKVSGFLYSKKYKIWIYWCLIWILKVSKQRTVLLVLFFYLLE